MSSAVETRGDRHLTVALALAAAAWLILAIQEVLLFLRPTPYGGRYVDNVLRYFPFALYYNVLGVLLVSAPALVVWLVWYHRLVPAKVARIIHSIQLGLLMLTVALDQIDNEVLRFMGIHLSRSLLRTYFRVNAWGSEMGYAITGDRGGPWLPFLVLFLMPLGLWWVGRKLIRKAPAFPRLGPLPMAATLSLVPLVFLLYMYNYHSMGDFRTRRTQPAIITLYAEFGEDLASGRRPSQYQDLARSYQENWFLESGDTAWRFSDPDRPLVREPLTPPVQNKGRPWNVIYIQLETFRGWNTGFLRPDIPISPTPFLDRMAHDPASAFWTRHLSMGPPTVSGYVSSLCSIEPHSFYNIMTSFTYTSLECLPATLRRHGYAAEHFTGFDPDWDNQTIWMRRWYDHYHFIKGNDRKLFQQAAVRVRELAAGSAPFLLTISSSTNHYPFNSPEPEFTLDSLDRPDQRIRNTMRFTDDVIRVFIEGLEKEPWFSHTLVVITGDHGYNLGEHGPAGQETGWRETVWVPLLIHGAHPRLRPGRHDEPASLLDIAPTVTDLLGIRDRNPWMGKSLLGNSRGGAFVLSRETMTFGEEGRYSMVLDPGAGKPRLYDAVDDPLQQKDISAAHPDAARGLRTRAEEQRQLVNYLLEANRVWQDSAGTPSAASARK
jgi:phosphoglycerol transferase MdoB-like AlkP superfamily enzyme